MLLMMKVLADPAVAAADPMTMPGKSTSKGLIEMKGLGLTLFPVREIGASVEKPVCPLLDRILIEVVWTPGETAGALVLPALKTYSVKLNTTGKEKEAPASRLPIGRLEFCA